MKNELISIRRIFKPHMGYAWNATYNECGRYRTVDFIDYTKKETINKLRREYNVSVPHSFY